MTLGKGGSFAECLEFDTRQKEEALPNVWELTLGKGGMFVLVLIVCPWVILIPMASTRSRKAWKSMSTAHDGARIYNRDKNMAFNMRVFFVYNGERQEPE